MVSANGSANASEAVWKSMPCLARFARLFPSSHSKAMTHYDKRKYICQYNITLALPRFSGALRRVLATSVFASANDLFVTQRDEGIDLCGAACGQEASQES